MPRRKTSGFTLPELLIGIGIIAVLITLVMSTMMHAVEASRRITCMANLRQLTTAWVAYATENRGQLTGAENYPVQSFGWVGEGNTDGDLQRGTFFQYCPDPNVYRCPHDANLINMRSYSISSYLNGYYKDYPYVSTMREIGRPGRTLVFIEEYDPRGYNMGSWAIPRNGDTWGDWPANWHNGGCNLSFADGHVEYMHFTDKRTAQINNVGAVTPNSIDLKQLQSWLGYD